MPSPSTITLRLAAVGGGLIGVAALAGCTATAADPSSSASGGSADYRDGTYEATGSYTSPGGPASIDVRVTLKDGTITAVTVVPKADNPTAKQYETQFAQGISGVAVGKPIAGLQVGAVSGSSLTGQGFEKALAAIRSDAAA